MAVAITTPTGNTHTYAAGSVLTINGTLNLASATFGTPVSVAQGGTARTTALSRFRARGNGDQSVSAGATVKLALNTAVENVGGYFDTTNFRWGPLLAGKYQIGFNILADDGLWMCEIYKNGVSEFRVAYQSMRVVTGSTPILESDGDDYFEIFITNQTGGVLNLYTGNSAGVAWGQELL